MGEPGYIGVLQQRAGSLHVKRLLLIKGNQISQVKEFSAFPCMGRCKSLEPLVLEQKEASAPKGSGEAVGLQVSPGLTGRTSASRASFLELSHLPACGMQHKFSWSERQKTQIKVISTQR